MTTTADWLHLRLGTPLPERSADDTGTCQDAEQTAGDVIARQRARAAQPLSVVFTGR